MDHPYRGVWGSGSNDLIKCVLLKNHSVASVESGLEGVGTDWRPREWFGGGVEIQNKLGRA